MNQDNLGPQFKTTTRNNPNGTQDTTIHAYYGKKSVGRADITENGTYLDSIEVHPDARRKGIGHALMEQVIKAHGDKPMKLLASPLDDTGPRAGRLKEFYSQYGFRGSDDSDYMYRSPTSGGTQ